jgi:Tfp pilus assembly protein PilO
MRLTERDRKVLIFVGAVLLLAGYWFVVLGPKHAEAIRLGTQVEQEDRRRDEALARARTLDAERARFQGNLAELVRLGQALPSTLDMPSVMIQLESAARGTRIRLTKITAGAREKVAATGAAASAPVAAAGSSSGGMPSAGSPPARGATAATPPTGGGDLDRVPVTLTVEGTYGQLADFLHRLKRFVRVEDGSVSVRGRLVTVDGFTISLPEEGARLTAEVQARVYLAPETQPSGPASAPRATGTGPMGTSTSTATGSSAGATTEAAR